MPLAPELFMQWAALKADQNKQLLGSVQSGLDNAYKNKALEAERAKTGLDLDKLATPALIKMQMGEQLNPQETAILKAWDLSETRKLAPDTSGNYRKINASIFDGQGFDLGAIAPSVQSMPSSFAGGTIPAKPEDLAGIGMDSIDMSVPKSGPPELQGLSLANLQTTGDPSMDAYRAKMYEQNQNMVGDALPVVDQPSGFNLDAIQPVATNDMRKPITVPPELAGNPNAAQKYLESAANAEAQLPLEVAKAGAVEGAKKRAETEANTEAKKKPLYNSILLIQELEKTIGAAPSGYAENLGAKASNLAGFPTKGSLAQGDVETKIEMLTTQLKNYIRGPGEGTWTDADQEKLDRLVPKMTDSAEVKRQKLKSLGEELMRALGKKPPTGFKYLGVEE